MFSPTDIFFRQELCMFNSSFQKFFIRCLFPLIVITGKGSAITTSDVFQKHLNPVFIESGSFYGNGISMALQAGFKEVYSIELAPHLYEKCCQRFHGNPHVHLYLGDSSIVLKNVLDQLHERATFWLDGHYSCGETAMGKTNTPILQELALIAEHPIKNHTILIDDVRQFGKAEFDFIDLNAIEKAIKEINPLYKIHFENGYVSNDVLVAEIL